MVAADLVRLVLAALLAVWHADIAVVYAAAFGLSAGSVFFDPAAGSLLPTAVADEQLVAANSGLWSAAVLAQIVMAPVAGVLAATVGFGWAFAVNAASFGVSALVLVDLRAGEAPQPVVVAGIWSQSRERSRYCVGIGCCGHWPWPRRWPRCRRGPPARCWYCWRLAGCTSGGRLRAAARRDRRGRGAGPGLVDAVVGTAAPATGGLRGVRSAGSGRPGARLGHRPTGGCRVAAVLRPGHLDRQRHLRLGPAVPRP